MVLTQRNTKFLQIFCRHLLDIYNVIKQSSQHWGHLAEVKPADKPVPVQLSKIATVEQQSIDFPRLDNSQPQSNGCKILDNWWEKSNNQCTHQMRARCNRQSLLMLPRTARPAHPETVCITQPSTSSIKGALSCNSRWTQWRQCQCLMCLDSVN